MIVFIVIEHAETFRVIETSPNGRLFGRRGICVASFMSRREGQQYLKNENYSWKSNNPRSAYYRCMKHVNCGNTRVLHHDNIYEYGEHAVKYKIEHIVKRVCRETIKGIPVHVTPLQAVDICVGAVRDVIKDDDGNCITMNEAVQALPKKTFLNNTVQSVKKTYVSIVSSRNLLQYCRYQSDASPVVDINTFPCNEPIFLHAFDGHTSTLFKSANASMNIEGVTFTSSAALQNLRDAVFNGKGKGFPIYLDGTYKLVTSNWVLTIGHVSCTRWSRKNT